MPTYNRFEDLPVWQTAAELYDHCDDFLEKAPPRLRAAFRNQLERAVLSVSNNIAEGFERGTTNELLAFNYIARGSSGEVRSMLKVLSRRPWIAKHRSELEKLIELAESCSRQLRGWAESLQNSDLSGHRHLNNKTRKDWQTRKSAEDANQKFNAMQRKILANLPPSNPARKQFEEKHGPLN